MSILPKTLFLTGGNGMVGRNLIETMPEDWSVLAPSRRSLNLLDGDAVLRAIEASAPDLIVHAAGRVGGIAANMAEPAAFLAENLRIGLNVLEAANLLQIPTLNLASSCIYPPEAVNPLAETMLLTGGLEPTNEGYALAKLAVLRYGQYCNRMSGRSNIKSLIPCNLYGRFDRFDPVSSHLIPAIIIKVHTARANHDKVEIWGDGSARREFLYAGDAATMIWHAVSIFDELPDIMNLGVGMDHSVLDYYRAAAEALEWHGEFSFDLSKPVGMKRKLVDTSHQQRLGFPEPGALAAGLRMTSDYFLESSEL